MKHYCTKGSYQIRFPVVTGSSVTWWEDSKSIKRAIFFLCSNVTMLQLVCREEQNSAGLYNFWTFGGFYLHCRKGQEHGSKVWTACKREITALYCRCNISSLHQHREHANTQAKNPEWVYANASCSLRFIWELVISANVFETVQL